MQLHLSTITKIINKWNNHHAVNNLPGRGITRRARTEENVNAVRQEMEKDIRISSPKRTPRRIAARLGISRISVSRILKLDLNLKPFRKVKVCKLIEMNKIHRLQRATQLLQRFSERRVRNIIFSDESNFDLNGYCNKQNSRVYCDKKSNISPNELLQQKSTFPQHIIVFFALSYNFKFPPIFVPLGETINAKSYQELILTPTFLSIDHQFGGRVWTFQQDSAPPHRARTTQAFIQARASNFISCEE